MVESARAEGGAFGRVSARMGFNPGLDGLRALSVAAVLGLHGEYQAPGGAQGVTVFFVISGYLITSLLLNEFAGSRKLRFGHFYLRRFARLAPALFVVVIATVTWLLITKVQFTTWIWGAIGSVTYSTDIIAAYFHNNGVSDYFQYTWSLGIEEQFYLVWPLLLLLFLWWGKLIPTLILLVLGIAGTWIYRHFAFPVVTPEAFAFGPFTHTDALLWGCGIAVIITRFPNNIVLRRISQIVGPMGAIVLGIIFIHGHIDQKLDQFGLAAVAATAVVGWVAYIPRGWLTRALAFPPLAFLGRISYGIYLWNILLLWIFGTIFKLFPAQTWWGLTWIGATVLMAWLSFQFVEKPLRRRFAPPQSHAVMETAAPVGS